MSDPRKITNLAHIKATVRFDSTGEVMDLYSLVDGDKLRSTPPEVMNEFVKQELAKISNKPNTVIYSLSSSFSYSDKDAMKGFEFGNIFVEAYLPYCLHLPNNFDMRIELKEQEIQIYATVNKIWTKKAQTEEGKSDNTDFYAEKIPLYHKASTIQGPRMPFEPEDGWESFITGRNIEKINDQNGIFRFTRVYIQFSLELPGAIEKITDKQRDILFSEIHSISLQAINRLIDNYRKISNEIHVRRLGSLKINMIYFTKQNIGFYLAPMDITTAMMNRPRKEIKELEEKLASGSKPELYELLLLNAKSSVMTRDFTMAVVESFQALEIFLENYLVSAFTNNGVQEVEYRRTLETHWRTKSRLNDVLKMVKATSLNTQTDLWNKWCHNYDKVRNEVFHAGKEPSEAEAKDVLETNEKVIKWIKSL